MIAGKYRIKRRIGAGGMGAVYEGEHVEIGKRVAIKVIEHQHAQSTELAARFRREARAASAVESEHIVQVFDVGQDERVGLYMVMELLAGEDLASRLEKAGGRIPVDEAVTLIAQAGRALGKAHAAGVVHRDLKPANLFLTTREDGSASVKILDFGISKLLRAETSDGPSGGGKTSLLTREGAVMGTPMYMSPEQAQGLPVDARSDVWSLASVLYEAIAGRTAYEPRDTYEQMIVQIVTKRPRPLAEIAPWVPGAIAQVIEAALAHDVDARTGDAALFAKSLVAAARVPADSASAADAMGPPSSSQIVAEPTTRGASPPPTGTGVVVGARPPLDPGIPGKRSRGALLAIGSTGLAVVIGVAALVTRAPASKIESGGGLVAAPPSASVSAAPDSAPSGSSSVAIVTTILPATASASAEPAMSSSAKALASRDAGVQKPVARPTSAAAPTGPAPTTTTTTKGGPSQ